MLTGKSRLYFATSLTRFKSLLTRPVLLFAVMFESKCNTGVGGTKSFIHTCFALYLTLNTLPTGDICIDVCSSDVTTHSIRCVILKTIILNYFCTMQNCLYNRLGVSICLDVLKVTTANRFPLSPRQLMNEWGTCHSSDHR